MATVILNPPANSDGANATKRRFVTGSGTVHATLGTCDIIDVREIGEYLAVKPPAGCTGLSVYAAETAADTFVLVDSIGTNGAVTVVASKWNVFDITKIGPFGFLKFVAAGANGTAIFCGKT